MFSLMTPKNSFTIPLDPAQQKTLQRLVRNGSYLPIDVPHTQVAVEGDRCTISLYKSGKCLVQGKGAEDFVTFVLEPLVLKQARLGYEDVLNPELSQPHFGVDESGKGDFFGPLVIAAAYVDASLVEPMRELDVKDSKRVTSDKKAMAIGRELRRLLGPRHSIVKIGPEAYNRLYAKMGNVNTLLAWGHARAIENLLEAVPDCPRAVADQFGNERLIKNALMKKGRAIKLEQRHRAESDLAVAAASLLAREAFLLALQQLGKRYDLEIPKGASAAVQETAVELIRKQGPDVLLSSVKCHFKTTDAVLAKTGHDRSVLGPEGQVKRSPEPWRRRN